MNHAEWPMPWDLDGNPELAVLIVLETALHISIRALIAAHPQLAADEIPYWRVDRSPPFTVASALVLHAQDLAEEIQRYRSLLLPDPPNAPQVDDLPF